MEPRAHHVLIGSFTILAAAAALLFALWLGKGPWRGPAALLHRDLQ